MNTSEHLTADAVCATQYLCTSQHMLAVDTQAADMALPGRSDPDTNTLLPGAGSMPAAAENTQQQQHLQLQPELPVQQPTFAW